MTPDSELNAEQLKRRKTRQRKVRVISVIVLILAIAGLTYMLMPLFEGFGQEGWNEKVRERIDSYGTVSGIFIFLGIQALQVPVAIVPAIQIVGGVLYGWFFGTILSYAGIVIGSLAVWSMVKWIGAPIVEAFFTEKSLRKFKFLEDEHKLMIILIVLELMPGIPKDLIAYLVPLTKIKMKNFFLYVLPFRIPSILLTTAFGNSITQGDYVKTIIFSAAMLIIALAGVLFKDKLLNSLNKRKEKRKQHKLNKQS